MNLIFGGNLVQPMGYVDSILRGKCVCMLLLHNYCTFSTGFILFITMMVIPTAVFALVASVHGKILVLSHAIGLIYTIIM